jgi:hypothetical protein
MAKQRLCLCPTITFHLTSAFRIALQKQAGMATMEGIGGSTLPSDGGANTAMVIAGSGKTLESGMFGSEHPTDHGTDHCTDHGMDHHPIAPPRTPRHSEWDQSCSQDLLEKS